MRGSRAKFVATLASSYSGLAIARWPAGAAEFTYKLNTDPPADNPLSGRAIEAAANITRESGGRLEVRAFPSDGLGSQSSVLSQVRLGAVEFVLSFDAIIESIVPVAGTSAIAFAFASHRQAWSALDGPFGKYLRTAIAKAGVYPFDKSWSAGFRELTNSLRPVRTPADLKGMKLRVPDSPILTALFAGLGASPTQVSSTETYTASQTHLIDGSEPPLVSIEALKLYEVGKYISITNHVYSNYTMLANAAAWQRLPKNLQDIVDRNFNAAALRDRDDFARLDATITARLKSQGCVFTDADIPAFKAAVRSAGLYGQWRDHYGAEVWALLENAVGPLH